MTSVEVTKMREAVLDGMRILEVLANKRGVLLVIIESNSILEIILLLKVKNIFMNKGQIKDQYHWWAIILKEIEGVFKSSTMYNTFIEGRIRKSSIKAGIKDQIVSTKVLSEKVLYTSFDTISIIRIYKIKSKILSITIIT